VTISDVAALAGVSTATVSRTLSAPDKVSASARERVLAAVSTTGYTPNVAARQLRVARSMMVLVVVPWHITPFFAELLPSFDRALAEKGYGMLVGDLNDRALQEPRLVHLAAAGQVDGIVLLNGLVLADRGRRVDSMGVPIVAMCVPAGDDFPAILVEDREGAGAAARHLLGLGHTRFGYLSGPAGNHNDRERWDGFRTALAAAGIDPCRVARFPGTFHGPSGVDAGRRFLALEERPTAVFCASDMMAIGFIHAVEAAGLRVPDDVSVVGFDGIEMAQYSTPALTTVSQPKDAMGRAAAEQLLALMAPENDAESERPRRVHLPVTLIPRASTAPPARLRGG